MITAKTAWRMTNKGASLEDIIKDVERRVKENALNNRHMMQYFVPNMEEYDNVVNVLRECDYEVEEYKGLHNMIIDWRQ